MAVTTWESLSLVAIRDRQLIAGWLLLIDWMGTLLVVAVVAIRRPK